MRRANFRMLCACAILFYYIFVSFFFPLLFFACATLLKLSEIGILPLLFRRSAKFPRKSRRIVDLRHRARAEERKWPVEAIEWLPLEHSIFIWFICAEIASPQCIRVNVYSARTMLRYARYVKIYLAEIYFRDVRSIKRSTMPSVFWSLIIVHLSYIKKKNIVLFF